MRNQLTENAATAAGYTVRDWECHDDSGVEKLFVTDKYGYVSCFNPLHDDADTFMLAVRMNIEVKYDNTNFIVRAERAGFEIKQHYAPAKSGLIDLTTEEYKRRAAREAIVQVAAHFSNVPFVFDVTTLKNFEIQDAHGGYITDVQAVSATAAIAQACNDGYENVEKAIEY